MKAIKIVHLRLGLRLVYLTALGATLLGHGQEAVAQIEVSHPPPTTVHIEINAARPASFTIPRTIFGSFLEPIGTSINQGLSAQLLENPSLEFGLWNYPHLHRIMSNRPELRDAVEMEIPLPWQPLNSQAGSRYAVHYGDAANSWMSLEVMGVPGKSVGIQQQVYLPIHRVLSYSGSLYAKHISGNTSLAIKLLSASTAEVLASTHINASDSSWRRYSFKLELQAGQVQPLQPTRFAIEVESDERVQLDQISLMPTDAIEGLNPDAVAMAKAMHVSLLRFGGNFTSTYNWRDGIGLTDKRISMRNLAWGIPEYNGFGTDEFLKFCELIGAEPQINLNMGTGTAAEAAAWVRYIRTHYKGKVLWELGNELWGKYQVGYPTPEQIPSLTAAFSQAVHTADPAGEKIATGERPNEFKTWNAALLTTPPGTFQYLSTHFIRVTNHVELANPTPTFLAEAAFALPVEAERRFKAMQEQIDGVPGFAGRARLALTEWLFASRGPGFRVFTNNSPSFSNMGGAIMAAGMLNTLIREVDIVPISNMTGIMDFAGIWKRRGQTFATPAYYAFRMYSTADVSRPVQVKQDSGTYSVHQGVQGYAEIANVPYLDTVAALSQSGDELTLFCVNRDLDHELTADIHLAGFQAAPTTQAEMLRAQTIYIVNDEIDPERIIPTNRTFHVDSDTMRYTFPQASITVITFHRHSPQSGGKSTE